MTIRWPLVTRRNYEEVLQRLDYTRQRLDYVRSEWRRAAEARSWNANQLLEMEKSVQLRDMKRNPK